MTLDSTQLAAFGERLRARRGAILADWRARVRRDERLTTGASLPKAVLDDHLGALLEDFEARLSAQGLESIQAGADARAGDAAAHGLHRWQQGFEMAELARELGRLNESVVAEIDRCSDEPGLGGRELGRRVHAAWARAHSVAVGDSADQFFKLQRMESAGHARDLEGALQTLRELEAERGALWRQAAHDLRGNLSVVSVASAGLSSPAASPEGRARLLASLDRNVRSLGSLLEDVTSLARLQGGQEERAAAPMDFALLARDLVAAMEGVAAERGLFLRAEGPASFEVSGDAVKIRRVLQNLALNALRYTARGGAAVSWGDSPGDPALRWFFQVADTGPGIDAGPGSPIASALAAAASHARDAAEASAAGAVSHVSAAEAARAARAPSPDAVQGPGEGIGLSIVKRLCGLLDATIEVESEAGMGTIFRIVLPKRYEA